MREVLNKLHDHRSLAAVDVEKSFDTQQIRPAQLHQCVHQACERSPRCWFVVGYHKAADTVTVRGLGNKRVALGGCRLGEPGRINLTVDGLVDLGAPIERAPW